MISFGLKTQTLPQKGDAELDWFYVGVTGDIQFTSQERGRLYINSQDEGRKFTLVERIFIGSVADFLQAWMDAPPPHSGWQEEQGLPAYILRFKAISSGAFKSPGDVIPIKGASLYYDMRGAGDENSIQSLVALVSGLSEGFQRIYENQACLDWYQKRLQSYLVEVAE